MRSVRCDVCGTKALMAASKCPKCSHPFAVRDGFGELLPLAHCPTCTSDYPLSAGACKWCGTPPEKATVGPSVWKAAGIVAFVGLGIGAWLVRDEEPTPKSLLLLPAVDSTTTLGTSTDSSEAQRAFSATPTTPAPDSAGQFVSTGVVATDSASNALASSDGASEVTAPASQSTVSLADSAIADDSLIARVDSVLPAIDSARIREPWLPPPSVIRRAPPPTATPVLETPPRATTTPDAATPTNPTRVADATSKRVTPPSPAPSRATPPRARAKSSGKVLAKSTAKRPPSRAAATRTTTKAAASASRKVASKPPARRPRASSGWVTSIARSWAVVRADASGRARIIGSVGPDTRVQLGESRGGWRRIKARGLAGWVDGRAVFVRAPAPRRSGRLASQ